MSSISKKRIIFVDFQDIDSQSESPRTEGLVSSNDDLSSFQSRQVSKTSIKAAARDDSWEDNEWRLEFEFLLKKLPPLDAGILQYILAGYNQAETAEMMGVSQQYVSQRIKKLVNKYRK